MEIEQLTDYITNEILNRLGLTGNTAKALTKSLVIVDESPFGTEKETTAKIGEINKNEEITEVIAIGHTSMCSSIIEKCGIDPVREAIDAFGIYQAIERSENLYILNLSISNASRICMLSDSSLVSKAVQYALLIGKQVIVDDICSGYNNTKVNNGYLKKILGLKDEIEAMGIRIIRFRYSPEVAKTVLLQNTLQVSPAVTTQQSIASSSLGKDIEKAKKTVRQVICLEDIKNYIGEVKIAKNSIITPLAQEYILDKRIKITTI